MEQSKKQSGVQSGTAGSYALVNGINLYSEIYDSGEPLILLHEGVIACGLNGSLRPTTWLAIMPGTTHYTIC